VLDDIDIAVVGAGLMGTGIAQVFAQQGARVALHDPVPGARAHARVTEDLVATGHDADDAAAVVARIRLSHTLSAAVARADVLFEAAPEDLDLKQRLCAEIDADARPDAILASNSSVMRITEVGARLDRPERAVTHR
jgi:3-hydroxybutyryl-CoA dehydrogenase